MASYLHNMEHISRINRRPVHKCADHIAFSPRLSFELFPQVLSRLFFTHPISFFSGPPDFHIILVFHSRFVVHIDF